KSVPDAIACKFTLDLEELVTLKKLCEKVLDKLS
ncbi:MarR family transcriptional regulator, partial [Vibrio sp. 1569]|nr:MarR family transcriptional regulator [Vibrio sp. 1569]